MERTAAYARSGDLSIAYSVHGEGPLDLVFVSGFVSHVELFWDEPAVARFFRRLASFSRLIMFDKRGQGLSDRLGRPPTLEESMDDVKAVMDAVGSERAALLGVSEGGPMAALFAATHPDRTAALILYGTYARLLRAPDLPDGVPAKVLDLWGDAVFREWGGPVGLPRWAPSAVGDTTFEEWWARLLRQGTSPGGAVDTMALYREIDVRPVLSTIAVPTLVLHRSGDRMVKPALGRHLADHIPEAKYVELAGEDHLPLAGDSDALIDEIEEFLVGTRRTHEADRVLATVLFTDIVGSTERAAAVGDREWRKLVEAHDALVRRQLGLHGGTEVKTMGDGFLATFDGPARAVRCARAIRDGLRQMGIAVRAGLHTGELDRVDGDVAGMAVNIAARVGALAEADQVLVSSTVKELVVGSELQFTPHGFHCLKGVPDRWRVFALV